MTAFEGYKIEVKSLTRGDIFKAPDGTVLTVEFMYQQYRNRQQLNTTDGLERTWLASTLVTFLGRNDEEAVVNRRWEE